MGRREKRRSNRNNKKIAKENDNKVGSNYVQKDFPASVSIGSNFFSSTQQFGVSNAIVAFTISPWFRAVVTKIAQHFSAVNWLLLTEKGSRNSIKNYKRLSFERRLERRKELAAVTDSRIMPIFDRPNVQMTGRAVRELMMIWYDISGESALRKQNMDGGFGLGALWPVAPQWVSELPTMDHPYFVITKNAKRVDIPQEEMIFWKQLDPRDPYSRGSGLGTTMGDEIELDETISKYQTATFKNDARPSQIINVKGGVKRDTLERVQLEFENKHRGFWNAGRTFWVPGDLSVQRLSQTFAELELTAQRTWLRDQFIHLYGVPPELLGITSDSNRATSLEAKTTMAEEVIIPRLESYKEVMQQQLIDPINPSWILDYEDPRPFNRKDQITYMSKKPEAASVREWRNVLNLEDRGEVDDYHLIPDGVTAVHINDLQEIVSANNNNDNNNTPPSDLDNGEDKKPSKKKRYNIKGTSFEDDALEALRPERLVQATSDLHKDELSDWIITQTTILGGVEGSLDILNPLLAHYFDDYNNISLKGINETTRKYLAASLTEGIALGESAAQLSKRVQQELLMSKERALMIARTEVNRAANYGVHEAMTISGVVTKKQWVATLDRRVRDVHLSLHGQVRGLKKNFEHLGHRAMYPGTFGEADQDINCRCTTIAVIDDVPKSADELDLYWKTYDQEITNWEAKLQAAFEYGIQLQMEDIAKATAKWI